MDGLVQRLQNENWSWSAIPVAFFIALYGRFWSGTFGPGARFYNPLTARSFAADVAKNPNIPPRLQGRIQRAEASVSNGIESLPLFVAAVITANIEGLDFWTLNTLCLSYLAIRVFYNWVYIYGQESPMVPIMTRTTVWFTSIFILAGLFFSSGSPKPTYWFSTAVKMQDHPLHGQK